MVFGSRTAKFDSKSPDVLFVGCLTSCKPSEYSINTVDDGGRHWDFINLLSFVFGKFKSLEQPYVLDVLAATHLPYQLLQIDK
mmetsp:Transcript_25005/g.69194  ORF Transcript_25005/g.69194 Transcript_25005/m.69194 type:complete len:83 (-) Transcript_25005:95-343(-)